MRDHCMLFSNVATAILLFVVFLSPGNPAVAQITSPAAADSASKASPKLAVVAPDGDSLFAIHGRVGGFTPEIRAKAITERIEKLQEGSTFVSDSLRIERSDFTTDIYYGDIPVLSIIDADARAEGMEPDELARLRVSQIQSAVMQYREENSWNVILKKTLMLLLLLVLLALILFAVNLLFRWIYKLIRLKVSPQLMGIRIGKAQFNEVEKIRMLLVKVAQWAKVAIILILIYVSLPLIIYLIPSSKGLTSTLLRYTLTPLLQFVDSFIDYIPNLFSIAVIVLLFTVFIRLFRFLASEISSGSIVISGFYKDWALPTFGIIQFLLYAFMFVVIFPYLPGSNSPVFQGVSVFVGILVSLGSAGSISNIMAGILLTYMRSFDKGDRIRVGDVEGDVVEKSMLVTRVRTIKNEEISVPNGTLMNGNVINFSKMARENKLIIYTSVTIGYDAPWREVHAALIHAATKTNRILKEPEPYVLQRGLNDFYAEYQINAYISEAHLMAQIYSDLHQSIQDSFNEAGIEIMSPHYASLRDGNNTTIPKNYLPGDYEKPGFRMESGK